MTKLARFLLERYLHPREFFGPAIYKQLVKTKKRENNVDIMQTKDFYLRLKIAGIRKTVKENENLNSFICLDSKFANLIHVKKMVKALEEIAQGEQLKMQEELALREHEMKEVAEEEEGDVGEDERKQQRKKANGDLLRETGIGGLSAMPSHMLTGGPGGVHNPYEMRGGPSAAKMAMLMGFNHLNTIEEEKHETQTSNYFRDGGESERDDSRHMNTTNFLAKGSRILNDEDLYLDQSGEHTSKKTSPPTNKKGKTVVAEEENEDGSVNEEEEEAAED
jgi:hypothetical protein